MKPKIKQIGFTLVELLLVIALIVILVSMVLIATNRSRVNSEEHLTRATIELLDAALQEYYEYTNEFPRTIAITPDSAFDSIYSQHIASLYAQLDSVPDSKKILLKIKDSQLKPEQADVVFEDYLEMQHPRAGYIEIVDSWGTVLDYVYDPDAMSFPMIISAGPDKNFDTPADNIDNRD